MVLKRNLTIASKIYKKNADKQRRGYEKSTAMKKLRC